MDCGCDNGALNFHCVSDGDKLDKNWESFGAELECCCYNNIFGGKLDLPL